MIPGNANPLLLATAAADAPAAAGPIKSLRFNNDDSAYLNRTPSSSGNRRTWTWSCWLKRSGITDRQEIFAAGSDGTDFFFDSDDKLHFYYYTGSYQGWIKTDSVFRDVSAWYHIVLIFDSTESTASNRVKVYVNNVLQSLTFNYNFSQNVEADINNTVGHYIGRWSGGSQEFADYYLADVHFVDGSALDPTSFGAYDDSGVWQAAAYSGTYGTNGFHLLDFANESTVGHDSSGNENDFTANNISENNNEAADFNAALSSTPFSDSSASSISITNTGSISTSSAGSNSFAISNAAEFTGGSNAGLTLGAAVDRTGLYTLDMYFKLDNLSQQMRLLTNESTTTGNALGAKEQGIAVATDGSLNVYDYGDPQLAPAGAISANTWYHYRLIADGTTIKASYLNGTAQTTSGSIQNFAANTALRIGYGSTSVSHSTDGLIGPIRIVPGNLGAPPSGGLSTTSGALSNSAAALNLSAGIDVLFDVPTNGTQSDTGAGGEVSGNYCTWNPLNKGSSISTSDGNLKAQLGSSGHVMITGTMAMTSGKYYWEVVTDGWNTSNQGPMVGVVGDTHDISTQAGGSPTVLYRAEGAVYVDGSSAVTGQTAFTTGNVIGVALDLDNNNITWYKDGVQMYQYTSLSSSVNAWIPAWKDSDSGGNAVGNWGQRSFTFSAPSDHKALCTTNLTPPTIADGSDYFDTKLWLGTGATKSITGFNFSPDFVWIKKRSGTTTAHNLFDIVRGANKPVFSNLTNQALSDGRLTAFNSDGFTLDSDNAVNDNTQTHVGWAWDAGANSNKTYTVKVVSDSGNKYRFDDFGTSAVTLDLEEGSTYVFDQSDSSNSGHPLRFSTTSDGTHNSGTEYTTGVTTTGTPGSAGAKTTIVVGSSVATLYYYCSAHPGMGGQANTNSTAGASNFDGSIQTTVRANQTAGFSIVKWNFTGSSSTFGHGLNAVPAFYLIKKTGGTANWYAYTTAIDGTLDFKYLNTADSFSNSSRTFPTSSVFSFLETTHSAADYIAYCFSPVSQYSSFGSYEGNGSADGTFVHTGFRPALVLTKCSSDGGNWQIIDATRSPYNLADEKLWPSQSYIENSSTLGGATADNIDILGNGFKLRTSNNGTNGSSKTYFYAAWASNPFSSNGGLAR